MCRSPADASDLAGSCRVSSASNAERCVRARIELCSRGYETEQDTFSTFLDEKYARTPNAQALSLGLYHEYKAWAERYGESPVSHRTFASLMSERGSAKTKTKYDAQYSGINLLAEEHYDTPRPAEPPVQRSWFSENQDGEQL